MADELEHRRRKLVFEVLAIMNIALMSPRSEMDPGAKGALLALTAFCIWALVPGADHPPHVSEIIPELFDAAEAYLASGDWQRFAGTLEALVDAAPAPEVVH